MFKIVCIDNNSANLTIGETYSTYHIGSNWVQILDDDGILWNFLKNRFISLKEYRKLKLDKIKNGKQNIINK